MADRSPPASLPLLPSLYKRPSPLPPRSPSLSLTFSSPPELAVAPVRRSPSSPPFAVEPHRPSSPYAPVPKLRPRSPCSSPARPSPSPVDLHSCAWALAQGRRSIFLILAPGFVNELNSEIFSLELIEKRPPMYTCNCKQALQQYFRQMYYFTFEK
jgi:hypothetical protein